MRFETLLSLGDEKVPITADLITAHDVAMRAKNALFKLFSDFHVMYDTEMKKVRVTQKPQDSRNLNLEKEIFLAFESTERQQYLQLFLEHANKIDNALYTTYDPKNYTAMGHFFSLVVKEKFTPINFLAVRRILLTFAHSAYTICLNTLNDLRSLILAIKMSGMTNPEIRLENLQSFKNQLQNLAESRYQPLDKESQYYSIELLILEHITRIMSLMFGAKFAEMEIYFRNQIDFHGAYKLIRTDAITIRTKPDPHQITQAMRDFMHIPLRLLDARNNQYRVRKIAPKSSSLF